MAEGDTIHRTARRLREALVGRPLTEASAPNPRSPLRLQDERLRSLPGRTLEAAEARGKHLLLRFDDGIVLHCHQGMRGSWQLLRAGEPRRRPRRSAWLLLATDEVEAAQFGGPTLELRTEAELRADRRLAGLGPDVLAPDFTVERGVAALRARGAPQTRLGETLLDQGVLAGIGNVYKAEGCFAARASPWRRLGGLGDDELRRVVLETASLMRAGLETGRMPRDVYGRAGAPCPRCGAPIRSRGQGDANRLTYWCPACQPLDPSLASG